MKSKYRICLKCNYKFRLPDLTYKMLSQNRIDTIYCVNCHNSNTIPISNRRFFE